MIWKEKGVRDGSYICFFNSSEVFREYYYFMVSCGYFRCDKNYMVRDKGTRPPIFFYIISGELHIEYDKCSYTAKANDIVLINCYKPQQYCCHDSCEFLFFHFDGNLSRLLTNQLIEQNGGPVFSLENALQIYQNINEPIMRLCYQDQISAAMQSSIVYSTLCMIQDQSHYTNSASASKGSVSSQIIEYINLNIREQFTVQQLASLVGLSPFYFSRLFKKETGHSPLDYVSIAKINYSRLMLRTTPLRISEIAEFLGYSSSASFINAFKARSGISPKKYRDQATLSGIDPTAPHE